MVNRERQENLEEIKAQVAKELKRKNKISEEEMRKIMQEANENVDFLNTLKEFTIDSRGKRVIFVDGKACLVYDEGVFYIEDSTDSLKSKKKLTRKQATELYVEYFFRYIMNPAIERKKMLENIRKVSTRTKDEKNATKSKSARTSQRRNIDKNKEQEVPETPKVEKVKVENREKQSPKEELVR